MSGPTLFLSFPGTARDALTFYGEVFGCAVQLHTYDDVDQVGPPDGIAYGYLHDGPVRLYGLDIDDPDRAFRSDGMMLSLLGSADQSTSHEWFERLAQRGQVIRELECDDRGITSGQVVDQFGLHWLIGYAGRSEPDFGESDERNGSTDGRPGRANPRQEQPVRRGPVHTDAS